MLSVRDIRKSFNGFAAVGGVSLEVPAQGVTAVIGPNGAGKSTLFNLLTGHLRADGGSVAFEGRDITGIAPHAICRMGVGTCVTAAGATGRTAPIASAKRWALSSAMSSTRTTCSISCAPCRRSSRASRSTHPNEPARRAAVRASTERCRTRV